MSVNIPYMEYYGHCHVGFRGCPLPGTNSQHLKRWRAPKGIDPLPTINFQVRTFSFRDGRFIFTQKANIHFLLAFCITWLHIRIHLDFCVRGKKSTVSSNPTTGFWLRISDTSWPNNSCKSKTIWRIVLWNLIIYTPTKTIPRCYTHGMFTQIRCKIATFKGKWLGK